MGGRTFIILCALLGLICTGGVYADALPVPAVTDSLGISVHLENVKPADWTLMAGAGFRVVRTDLAWQEVEKRKGVYNWARYDAAVAAMRKNGLRPLLILDYGNPLYSPMVSLGRFWKQRKVPAAPVTAAERQAFVNFARAAVARYKDADPIWELWNEPDLDHFWPPKANPEDYIALASQTCYEMRKVAPAAVIVGPGASHTPVNVSSSVPLLEAVLRSDLPGCLTAVSVHPYELDAGDALAVRAFWQRLHEMGRQLAGREVVFINSEWGRSALPQTWGQINPDSEEKQTQYWLKSTLLNLAAGVPVTVWYDWRDDGKDIKNPEHHYGMVGRDGREKPVLKAVRALSAQVGGMSLRCSRMQDGRVVLGFAKGEVWRYVGWTGGNPLTYYNDKPTDFICESRS